MRRLTSFWVRLFSTCVIVMLLHWPMADYHWASYSFVPPKTNAGGDPFRISGPRSELTGWLTDRIFPFALGVPEAAVSSLAAILIFIALTRWFGQPDGQTRCRRCLGALRKLATPQCPACGEPI